ncbi:MAG: nuclease-related domain-containing protein [Streptosporangiaceae bacterium]
MRLIELSNHPGDQLRKLQQERETAEAQTRSDYQEALARHGRDLAELHQRRDTARAQHRWWAWLRWAVAVGRVRRAVPPPARVISSTSAREESIKAGIEGEQQVASRLGQVLGDDWVLLRGYRNRSGEIDHLLLGPRGLVAIESKHHSTTVHCDGDKWWFDKYDKYGNHVGRGMLEDGGGRSPSQQLNEPASALEGFLASRRQPVPVQRVVLLTHPRSRLGTHRNPTVGIATSTGEVVSLLNDSQATLDPPQLRRVEDLIVRDHQFHQSRRGPRR